VFSKCFHIIANREKIIYNETLYITPHNMSDKKWIENLAQNETNKSNTDTKNKEAAGKLAHAVEQEQKPKGKISPLGVTGGGTQEVNITTLWPTYQSQDGQTSATLGISGINQKPHPDVQEKRNDIGLGVSLNTTPEAMWRGIKKIGKWVGNIFKKKK
jgi:hypothetical protein